MSDSSRTSLHSSVFTKLTAIMVVMAFGLLISVSVFFWFVIGTSLHSSMDLVLRDYIRRVAPLDLAAAKDLKARVHVDTRYEGPGGAWTTNNTLPNIADVQQGRVGINFSVFSRRNYYLASAPDGGNYLFGWSVGQGLGGAHSKLVIALLITMAVVIVLAYVVLSRLLQPLRTLTDGVTRLGAGDLNVVVPNPTRDEFARVTDAFNQMVRRVRAMIAARDQLLLDVSHELRSPVTRMKVALELLPEGPQRAGMAMDLAEMERMIAELLELERLRSGQGIQKKRQNLLALLREVAEQFQDSAPGVVILASAPEYPVNIDGDKIRAVVRNLLENAAKYSLPTTRPVEIAVRRENGATLVRVTDDGPGIPETDAERVFEPFFRVDRSRSKSTGGYGLGLSLCKRVMQAHGGDITLERAPGRGASFLLHFPASPADARSEAVPGSATSFV